MVAVGTPAALRFIKEKFLNNEMKVAQMAQAMIASVHMVTATRETLEIFKVCLPQRESVSDKCGRMDLVRLFCSRTWQSIGKLQRAQFCTRSSCSAMVP